MKIESLSLRWRDQGLEVLDQTLLPDQEKWISIRHPQNMVTAIRELRVRGAPLIGVAAALALGQYVDQAGITQKELIEEAEKLRAARPTAVNLMWAIDRMRRAVESESWRETVKSEAQKIFQEDVQLCARIGELGSALFAEGDQILTHCNTGSLATAGVGTALGVIQVAHKKFQGIHVFVDETRPLLQGGRLTTYELERLNIPYTLLCDNMAGFLMSQRRINKVIVGADRIARNGDFANKVGTYSLAVLCHYHRIPFFVAAPYSTLDLNCQSGQEIPIEERAGTEVRGVRGAFGDVRWAPSKSEVYNPAFDVTPADLVTAWILDTGVYSLQDVRSGSLEKGR